jgi:hypothetical protein
MSAAGITVHEAGQDSRAETFDGFPWITRLRYIMENAHNLAEVRVCVCVCVCVCVFDCCKSL